MLLTRFTLERFGVTSLLGLPTGLFEASVGGCCAMEPLAAPERLCSFPRIALPWLTREDMLSASTMLLRGRRRSYDTERWL